MTNYHRLAKENKDISNKNLNEMYELQYYLNNIALDAERTAQIAKYSNGIIDDIDNQFERATKLNSRDVSFLFFATALQCIRQYVIGSITQRTDHNESDKFAHEIQKQIWGSDNKPEKIKKYREEGARYRATTEEIMNSFSVPYDVVAGTKQYNVGGENIGLGGKNHRYKTLGHDPLFGWVFGTANIMTNTLTNNVGKTFHVKNSCVISYGGYDKTIKMFEHVKLRSSENLKDLGICVVKQGLHIMSDTYSKEGIVLPGTVKLDSELANTISSYGMDFGNVVKVSTQAGFSVLINQIIAMVHGLMYDKSIEYNWSLYSVRTRKILLYSNLIASISNVIAVAIGTIAGVSTGNAKVSKQSLNYLDIGGLIVTIHRIITDSSYIYEIKKEFLEQQFYNVVNGSE